MKVKILKESGYEEALFGLSLSYYDHNIPPFAEDDTLRSVLSTSRLLTRHDESAEVFWTDTRLVKAEKIAKHLANKTIPDDYETRNNLAYISAEQKFLESIDVWVYIQASRDFWSEFDTYRVDMTKQSSSTMHTLSKRFVTEADFEEGTYSLAMENLNTAIRNYGDLDSKAYHNVSILKKNLPEGWRQERVVKTSYKTLKWILEQRDGHRLDQWKQFYKEILEQLAHPEFIQGVKDGN